MKKKLIILSLLAILCCCKSSDDKSENKGDFYETIAGWDIRHIPIIQPFRATSTYPEQWGIAGFKEAGDIQVLAFGVTKQYIYGKIPDNNLQDTGGWFLLNTNNLLYAEYSSETELNATLTKYNLERNPVNLCEEYFKQLSKGGRCYWFPQEGKSYPKYQDFRPDTTVVIKVEEDEKGINFEVLGDVTKDISKIYYFKMLYNKKDNERFFISFGHSYPMLIKNNDIIPAYAEGNTLSVSVYIPYDIAESKGIKEENRIVVTKKIALKD